MSSFEKYLKYKNKYIELKKKNTIKGGMKIMTGGNPIDVLGKLIDLLHQINENNENNKNNRILSETIKNLLITNIGYFNPNIDPNINNTDYMYINNISLDEFTKSIIKLSKELKNNNCEFEITANNIIIKKSKKLLLNVSFLDSDLVIQEIIKINYQNNNKIYGDYNNNNAIYGKLENNESNTLQDFVNGIERILRKKLPFDDKYNENERELNFTMLDNAIPNPLKIDNDVNDSLFKFMTTTKLIYIKDIKLNFKFLDIYKKYKFPNSTNLIIGNIIYDNLFAISKYENNLLKKKTIYKLSEKIPNGSFLDNNIEQLYNLIRQQINTSVNNIKPNDGIKKQLKESQQKQAKERQQKQAKNSNDAKERVRTNTRTRKEVLQARHKSLDILQKNPKIMGLLNRTDLMNTLNSLNESEKNFKIMKILNYLDDSQNYLDNSQKNVNSSYDVTQTFLSKFEALFDNNSIQNLGELNKLIGKTTQHKKLRKPVWLLSTSSSSSASLSDEEELQSKLQLQLQLQSQLKLIQLVVDAKAEIDGAELNDLNFQKWNDIGRPINTNILSIINTNENIANFGDLSNLPNLEKIMWHNSQVSLKGMQTLIYLKKLDLNNTNLTSLDGIQTLANLKELNIRNNQLKSLYGIQTLVNLKKLDIRNNQLKSLDGIQTLVNLKKLNISDNLLISINQIQQLKKLNIILCYNNKISSFNDILEEFTNLKKLNCSNNLLSSIDFNNLTKLITIDCSNNKLQSMRNLDCLINLKELLCEGNDFSIIDMTSEFLKLFNNNYNIMYMMKYNNINFNDVEYYNELKIEFDNFFINLPNENSNIESNINKLEQAYQNELQKIKPI
jgi:Leucine-rich repeat (LRR) protein